jgi:hemerythrin
MIPWKEEYTTGVDTIDEQHHKLLEIADRAYDLLKNDLYTDKYDKIVEILLELKDYTIYHFDSEEAYMLSIGYKKILSHKVEHTDFIDKINNIDFTKIDQDQDKYILELLGFVVDWIDSHILKRDKLIVAG